MNIVDPRATGEIAQDHINAVIESRVSFRRRLAEKITITLLQQAFIADLQGLVHADIARFIEDLANAVAERVAAREDRELGLS